MALSDFETIGGIYSPAKRRSFNKASLLWAATVLFALTAMTVILTIAATPLENLPARQVTQVQYGETNTLSPYDLEDGTVSQRTLPYGHCCAYNYAVFEFPLTASDRLHVDPAILLPRVQDNIAIFMDGTRIAGVGKVSNPPHRYGKWAHLHRLPPRILKDAKLLQIVVARESGRKMISPVYIGDHADLWPARTEINLMRVYLPSIHIVICFFVAVFSAAAASLFRARSVLYATSALMTTWGALTVMQLISTPWLSAPVFGSLYYMTFWAILMAATCFVAEWTSFLPTPKNIALWRGLDKPMAKKHVRRLEAICGIIWLLMSCISAYLVVQYGARGSTYANIIVTWAALIIMPLLGLRLIAYFSGHIRDSIIEAAAFLMIIGAVIFDMAMLRFADISTDLIFATSLFFPFALLLSLAHRAQAIFDAALATNEELDASVKAAEVRILAGQEALREQEKQNTLTEERARIMRDMHDGVGGRLITLLSIARRKNENRVLLEREIQSAIDELRLMIDSLDSVGTSLDTALALFQERAQIRLASDNIGFHWQNRLDEAADSFSPKVILQVYRVLQEALTNIQKHAGAKNVRFSVQRTTGDQPLQIIFEDDGCGIQKASRAGRGLRSMEKRAKAIGANLFFENTHPGTRVILALPERLDD